MFCILHLYCVDMTTQLALLEQSRYPCNGVTRGVQLFSVLCTALNLLMNTQPVEHPVLLIEMSNVDCLGLTRVNKYKCVWILFTKCDR